MFMSLLLCVASTGHTLLRLNEDQLKLMGISDSKLRFACDIDQVVIVCLSPTGKPWLV